MMKIEIPNPLSVTFFKVTPPERFIGPFQLTSVPAVSDRIRMTNGDEVFGGVVLRVIWHLDTENPYHALVEVYFNDEDMERVRNKATGAEGER